MSRPAIALLLANRVAKVGQELGRTRGGVLLSCGSSIHMPAVDVPGAHGIRGARRGCRRIDARRFLTGPADATQTGLPICSRTRAITCRRRSHDGEHAGRYAAALFELAKDRSQLEQVERDLALLQAMLDSSADFAPLVLSPV